MTWTAAWPPTGRGGGPSTPGAGGPLELVYAEEQPDKPAALRREAAVKKLRRPDKEALIRKKE